MARQDTRYHGIGPVRGSCGHRHTTIQAAHRCIMRDGRVCKRLGGGAYSDRTVERLDGEPLTEDEWLSVEFAFSGEVW